MKASPARRFTRLPMVLAMAAATLTADFAAAQLEEIVVTAQRRSESSQDVPIALTAYDGAKLKQTNVARTSDLSAQTPNMQAVDGNFGLAAPIISMRGVSNVDFTPISNTPIAVYSDGVILNNIQTHGFAMFDLERVEILRGPQGTLFGRNSTTGAMSVVSGQPTEEFESGVEVTAGQFGRERLEGYVSGPLVEGKLNGRLSLMSNRSDGYVKDQFGKDAQNEDVQAARIVLDANFTDNLTGQFKLAHQKIDNKPVIFHNRLPVNVVEAGEVAAGNNRFPNPSPGGADSDFRRITLTPGATRQELGETIMGSATFDWDIGDLTFTSVTGYVDHDFVYRNDEDSSAAEILKSSFVTDQKQFTQEFRLARATDNLDWVAGVYYMKESTDSRGAYDITGSINRSTSPAGYAFDPNNPLAPPNNLNTIAAGLDFAYGPGTGAALLNLANAAGVDPTLVPSIGEAYRILQQPGASGFYQGLGLTVPTAFPEGDIAQNVQNYSQSLESLATFAHMKYTINDEWSATLGIRWSQDEKDLDASSFRCAILPEGVKADRVDRVVGFGAQSAAATDLINAIAGGACGLNGGNPTVDSASEKWDAWSGKVSLEYAPQDDVMIYASLSQGYKGGGFDGAAEADLREVDPEKLLSYEIGAKTSWFDNRMILNAALFHYDYTDFQAILAVQLAGAFVPDNVTFNVPESEITGAEIELQAQPVDNLNISLGLSWLESEVSKSPALPAGATVNGQPNFDLSGTEFRYAPHFTFNGVVSYDFDLGDFGYVTPQLDWVFTDEYYTDVLNNQAGKVDDYWVTNARINWTSVDDKYYATMFVENLENKVINTSNTAEFIGSVGTSFSTYSRPRTFGVTFGARF